MSTTFFLSYRAGERWVIRLNTLRLMLRTAYHAGACGMTALSQYLCIYPRGLHAMFMYTSPRWSSPTMWVRRLCFVSGRLARRIHAK